MLTRYTCLWALLLTAWGQPSYALPPPELLFNVGASFLYPSLLIFGAITICLRYLWLRLRCRRLLPIKKCLLVLLLFFVVIIPELIDTRTLWSSNHPMSLDTLLDSQPTPTIADIRTPGAYNQVHILGAKHFPLGNGLDNYLLSHPDEKVIIHCSLGVSSATLRWLESQPGVLKMALDKQQLFYLPGGLTSLLSLGSRSPFPLVFDLPATYANYLLSLPSYARLDIDPRHETIEESIKKIRLWQHRHAQQTPIIVSKQPSKQLSRGLADAGFHQLYFSSALTHSNKHANMLLLCLLLSCLVGLLILRKNEIFLSLRGETPRFYHTWSNIIPSVGALIASLQSYAFPLPFDSYLYSLGTTLPMNQGYRWLIYLYFTATVCVHLLSARQRRLTQLHHQIRAIFTPKRMLSTRWPRNGSEKVILACLLTYLLKFLTVPLLTMLIIALFASLPWLVDILLSRYLLWRLKRAKNPALTLLKFSGFGCAPKAKALLTIDSKQCGHLAQLGLKLTDSSLQIGLFSGKIYTKNEETYKASAKQKTTPVLKKGERKQYCRSMHACLMLFQQDLSLTLTTNGQITAVHLYNNHFEPITINKLTVLKQYLAQSSKLSTVRFSNSPYYEAFNTTTPLSIDVVKRRWLKDGGMIRALRKFGIIIKKYDCAREQIIVLGDTVYQDSVMECTALAASRLHLATRNMLISLATAVAADTIPRRFIGRIQPRALQRIHFIKDLCNSTLSNKQLYRHLIQALQTLSKEGALWQAYAALLHQCTFSRLESLARQEHYELSSLLVQWQRNQQSTAIPAFYELGITPHDNKKNTPSLPIKLRAALDAFMVAETLRTNTRNLYLQEWQHVGLLLEKCQTQLKLHHHLSFLDVELLSEMHLNTKVLNRDLEYFSQHAKAMNQIHLPSEFSIKELEQYSIDDLSQLPPKTTLSRQSVAAAGLEGSVTGIVVYYHSGLSLADLHTSNVLMAENLSPEELLSCTHLRGIVLKQGSYLSHVSILARENNIPLIIQSGYSNLLAGHRITLHPDGQFTQAIPSGSFWSYLDEIHQHPNVGTKAQNLATLDAHGFQIPETVCLFSTIIDSICQYTGRTTPNSIEGRKGHGEALSISSLPNDIIEELKQILTIFTQNNNELIIRSSANIEDQTSASCAGLFRSKKIICQSESLLDAVCYCLDAAWGLERFDHYLDTKTADVELNLMIQTYIDADYGGVLFTQSEKSQQMHLEISPQGAEGIAQGENVLASILINENGDVCERLQGHESVLSQRQYRQLYQLGRKIEKLFDHPQDIEWVLHQETFYIIQSRGILYTRDPSKYELWTKKYSS